MHFVHPRLSTFAVEKALTPPHLTFWGTPPRVKGSHMRILEMAVVGILSVGAQILVAGTVLI